MTFSGIKQTLANIDYAWNKPQTYAVFIPGLSILIQKTQMANILPLQSNVTEQTKVQADAQSRKFVNICKWHLRGSMIQIVASIIAINLCSTRLFALLAISAAYELVDTFMKGWKNPVTLCEFYPDGSLKSMIAISACNIF